MDEWGDNRGEQHLNVASERWEIPPAKNKTGLQSPDLWAACLDTWTFSMNLQRFRVQLGETADPGQRAVLAELIREYERKFREATAATGANSFDGGI